jgi:hypothetical protein
MIGNSRGVVMDTDVDRRQAAHKRLEAKRGFSIHLGVYLLVNAFLVVIWLMTGRGYFWPIWPIAGWGIGLAAHRWAIFPLKPISEEDIRREMKKGR